MRTALRRALRLPVNRSHWTGHGQTDGVEHLTRPRNGVNRIVRIVVASSVAMVAVAAASGVYDVRQQTLDSHCSVTTTDCRQSFIGVTLLIIRRQLAASRS